MFNKILIRQPRRNRLPRHQDRPPPGHHCRGGPIPRPTPAPATSAWLTAVLDQLGPAAAPGSYLVIEKIIDAACSTGAQAIHPGYGFLSENEDFATPRDAAHGVFIGPPASAIHRAMGSKSEAKKLMGAARAAHPGYHGDDQDPALFHGRPTPSAIRC